MAIANLINKQALIEIIKEEVNESMISACEPIIQEAIINAEKAMREQLARHLIAIIHNEFSVERMGNDLRIIVRGASNN